jgi:hypothetical protein
MAKDGESAVAGGVGGGEGGLIDELGQVLADPGFGIGAELDDLFVGEVARLLEAADGFFEVGGFGRVLCRGFGRGRR